MIEKILPSERTLVMPSEEIYLSILTIIKTNKKTERKREPSSFVCQHLLSI